MSVQDKHSQSNSFGCKTTFQLGNHSFTYYSLPMAGKALGVDLTRLPYSLKVLLENLLRYEDGRTVTRDDIQAVAAWLKNPGSTSHEIAYRPARVLMQDFTGVPAVVDLAAMRDAVANLGGDPKRINPLAPVDLVIDHSVQVDQFGSDHAFNDNVALEMQRNNERYMLLRSAQKMFDNFRTVPPGTGICHQVNLEYLAKVVWTKQEHGETLAYPDSCVGTDSHTTMVNGLAVLGWGVGGIEAESAMLGQPISMTLPEVIGFKVSGKTREGATATDVVLTITQMLRKKGVVGKFVEFYGDGLNHMPLADRATIANMAPEYGATCGFFPVDAETIKYLKLTARDEAHIALVEHYAKAQGMWRDAASPDPIFTETLELHLADVEPSLSGPKRPQDRVSLRQAASAFQKALPEFNVKQATQRFPVKGQGFDLGHGDVVIAAITSCTNTSNPSVMIAAGLVARKAIARGLSVKPWVKTSLAPGSKVVTEYLEATGLNRDLDKIGFNLVGYGCTTCIGNSGPLPSSISQTIRENDITAVSVLSGNRNFEGRVHPQVKANYLASPPLVVAYALAGSMQIDISQDALGQDPAGGAVYLKDIWPSSQEVAALVQSFVTPAQFKKRYADVFTGDAAWQAIPVATGTTYRWSEESTYIKHPPYFDNMQKESGSIQNIEKARILALFGDSITTDHISPAGNIAKDSPAAQYLQNKGVKPEDFNSYGSRRGNDEIMVRGTFANIRIRNEMAPGTEGGWTSYIPTGKVMSIYDAAMHYKADHTPLIVIGGKDYGMGSSRDWAAKGTSLLGVKAVIAESFERIHRSNLVGMGVLPLTFLEGENRKTLQLNGSEILDIKGLSDNIKPKSELSCIITRQDGSCQTIRLLCRIETEDEIDYYKNGGILHSAIRMIVGHTKNAA